MVKIKKEMYESPKTECLMVGTQSIICASGAPMEAGFTVINKGKATSW